MTTLQHFEVAADPKTGEWLGEPTRMGSVDATAWCLLRDSNAVHFDTYEVDGETRAITVRWVEAAD